MGTIIVFGGTEGLPAKFSKSAGARRGTVEFEVVDEKSLRLAGAKVKLSEESFVVLHNDSAGTWHGAFEPQGDKLVPLTSLPVAKYSQSGGGDVVLLIGRMPPGGIAIKTSGYDGRRGWRLQVFSPEGEKVYDGPPKNWGKPEIIV